MEGEGDGSKEVVEAEQGSAGYRSGRGLDIGETA